MFKITSCSCTIYKCEYSGKMTHLKSRHFIVVQQCCHLLICIRLHKYRKQSLSVENYINRAKDIVGNMTDCIRLPGQSVCVCVPVYFSESNMCLNNKRDMCFHAHTLKTEAHSGR